LQHVCDVSGKQFPHKPSLPLLAFWPNWPNVGPAEGRTHMHIMSAKDAKYGFDRLIDMADFNEVGGETKHEEVAA
jgi:hypothetical protein